ncbi:MAG: peptidase [Bellilinea sp.]|nr:MAG: peptidase [Bellilinea sp.]
MRSVNFRIRWLGYLFAVVLSSCASPTNHPVDETPTLQEITPIPAEEETIPTKIFFTPTSDTPQPTPAPFILPTYTIHAVYDATQMKVSVNQLIQFTHLFHQPLNKIFLIVEPNRFLNGFVLNRLEDQITGRKLEWELQQNWLQIQLDEPMSFQQSISIVAEYTLQLPEIPPPSETRKPQIYGYTQRQTNLVDWYLWLPPFDEETGWVIHPPSFFGEYTVYPLADFEVYFDVVNSPRQVVVAASSSPVVEGQNHWEYRFTGARNFAISISADFEVNKIEVDGVKISHYFFPLYRHQGEVVLNHTIQAFQLYSELFGELPRQSISVVQADFLDGMEFDGLFFLSKGFYDLYDGTDQGYLTLITVHETAHQWWYAVVANDQAQHPWLDEALCTYSERLYYERYLPELVDWWWFYRVNFYQPEGVIDLPVYEYTGYLAYRDAVYLRGAEFLEEFRNALGDVSFFEGLARYYDKNTGRIAAPRDFFAAFNLTEEEIRGNFNSFFGSIP